MALEAHLQITKPGWPDRTIVVRDTMTIGRDSDNDIVLESITVSRFHAVLVREAAEVLLVDLESSNGTLVNGVLIRPDEPLQLANEDELQFGQVVASFVTLSGSMALAAIVPSGSSIR